MAFLRDLFLLICVTLGIDAVAAGTTRTRNEVQDQHAQIYDYIIVGGGVAGMVLTEQLSRQSHLRILLLEAGPDGTNVAAINTPGLVGALAPSPYSWNYTTVPQSALGNRSTALAQGHALGGGSAINYMGYCRGAPSVYDEWAEISGDPGLKWENLFHDFRATTRYEESYDPSPHAEGFANRSAYGDGPLSVTHGQRYDGFDPTWQQALIDGLGVPERDLNGGYGIGATVGFVTQRPSNYTRDYALEAYGWQTAGRRNVEIKHGARVTRILFRDLRAEGVEYVAAEDNSPHTLYAREIIVSSGAIGTPRLLMLSGVGPATHLRSLGIPVVADIPAVGLNLRDHAISALDVEVAPSVSTIFTWLENKTGLALAEAEYKVNASGPLANTPASSFAVARVPDDVLRAAHASFHLALPADRGMLLYESADAPFVTPAPNASIVSPYLALVQPKASGWVRLQSADWRIDPLIDPNYYGSAEDRAIVLYGYKKLRAIMQSPIMSRLVVREVFPGPQAQSDEELLEAIFKSAQTFHHPVGTVSLGAVLDSRFRVKGLEGLRVVDSSAIPYPPVCHLQSNVYAVAHRVARMIVEEERGR